MFRHRFLAAAALAVVAGLAAAAAVAHFGRPHRAAKSQRQGTIEFRMERPGPLSAVSVLFVDWSRASGCTTRSVGACRLETCALGGPARFPAAGRIMITGGRLPPTGVRMKPTASGAYEPFVQGRTLWQPGDMMHVRAAGGAVPAFSASVSVPPTVEIEHFAAPNSGATLAVDRSRSLNLSWSNTEAQRIEVIVAAAMRTPHARLSKLICSAPASAHRLRIPSSALGALPNVSGPPNTARLSAWASDRSVLEAGNWSLSVSADTPARAQGRVAAAAITLR